MIVVFLIGVMFIALGIYTGNRNRKLTKNGKVRAVVYESTQSSMQIISAEVPCYELKLEIPTSYGFTYKVLRTERVYNTGDIIEVYYNEQEDSFELAAHVEKNNKKGPLALIGFGVIWCAIFVLVFCMSYSEAAGGVAGRIFSYGIAAAFVAVGWYNGIIKPARRKREMKNCHITEGEIIDFKTRRRRIDGHRRNVYQPVYGFNYNGQKRYIYSTVSGNKPEYCEIGRKVTIVINSTTDEIYCLEDSKRVRNSSLLYGVIGLALFIVILMADTSGKLQFGNGNKESSRQGRIELDINEAGYSNKSVELPDERYNEYVYVPVDGNKAYAYNIKIYHYGIGVVTIFPNESNGRALNQTFSFYVDYENIKTITKDAKDYDFETLAGEVIKDDEYLPYRYLYYYNGKERTGSGGRGIESDSFDYVADNIKACVPQAVWKAIREEIEEYYK